DNRGCGQVTPEIGVTSTPVIDLTAGTHGVIYVVAMSKDSSSNYHQRLHALDVTSGAELFSGPKEITATYPATAGGAATSFEPGQYAERAALLLASGAVYTSWTSHCDNAPYGGWIIAYDQTTLAQKSVLNVAPNSGGVGPAIWMAGDGSGGEMLLPDLKDSTNTVRHLMVGAGKDGNIYVVDRDSMGKFNASMNQIWQQLSAAVPSGVFSSPAYFNNTVYYGDKDATLKAFGI